MHKAVSWVLAAGLLVAAAAAVHAQPPAPAVTKVTLAKLHCKGCAQAVGKSLAAVRGVAQVRIDFEAKAMYVTHAAGQTPSPRGLWEAVQDANHKPTQVRTPTATYTSLPPS